MVVLVSTILLLHVASDTVARLLGGRAAKYFTVAMIVSAFGSLHAAFLTGPRVPYAMARGGSFFFLEPAGGWASKLEDAKLTAKAGQNQDEFGASTSVATNGSTIVVGAPNSPFANGKPGAGAVYVFQLTAVDGVPLMISAGYAVRICVSWRGCAAPPLQPPVVGERLRRDTGTLDNQRWQFHCGGRRGRCK